MADLCSPRSPATKSGKPAALSAALSAAVRSSFSSFPTSPRSILDGISSKSLPSEPGTPRSPDTEIRRLWKAPDSHHVGLAAVSGHFSDRNPKKILFSTAPKSRPPSAAVDDGELPETDIEMSEDYTCVITNGDKTTVKHIFRDRVFAESCDGVLRYLCPVTGGASAAVSGGRYSAAVGKLPGLRRHVSF